MSFLVTGASSGIGCAIALALAARGQQVTAVARRAIELEELKRHFPGLISTVQADLATDAGRRCVIESVRDTNTRALSGIVHAAASTVSPESYAALNTETLLAHMNVHVMAPIHLNNELHTILKGARVVFIDSFSAANPRQGWVGYSIVKAAAQMAAKAVAVETSEYRVIRVFPGAVDTPLVAEVLNSHDDSDTVQLFKRLRDTGELVQPDRVGKYVASILLLATDEQLDEREFWDLTSEVDSVAFN